MLLVDARSVSGELILRERTFFGAYRVIAAQRPDGLAHMILHGSTIHGVQWRDSAREARPLSYYAQGGAVYDAVRAALPEGRPGHAALIGLGSGAMACVLREQDRATFIEIDPAVVAIARDPRYFTYLEACPRRTEVRLGDGRLEMQRFEPGSLDVVLGDAFSSDAIPVHLLTREAVRLYMRALRPEGALVLHVSNRHLAVANEAVRVAAAEGFAARHWRSPTGRTDSTNAFENPSTSAVVITRTKAAMDALGLGAHWTPAPALAGRAWSDDFIPLVRTMREPAIDARPTNAIPDSAPPPSP
jgi:SAM-dependent methyltransferase